MTYREKKEYLASYIESQHKILALQNELEEWRTIATNITQKITPVIVNTNEVSSKVERCAIKCAEIQEQIVDEIALAEYNRIKIKATIMAIKDSRRRSILEMRYLGNMPVKTIARKMDKDTDNIYKMIRTGIKSMKISEEWSEE